MAHYLAGDIRMRMIGAVEGGMSRNGAAKRFGVSAANVMCWMDEYLRCGRTAPKPRSVDRHSGRELRDQHDPRFLLPSRGEVYKRLPTPANRTAWM